MDRSKIVLVTGGSGGLGSNMAVSLAKKKLDVIITYNSNKVEADAVVAEVEALGQKALALSLNLQEFDKFDSFFANLSLKLEEKFQTKKFDFLVNNAGIGINVPFVETTIEQFEKLFSIQFKAPFFITQKALEFMNDGGGIVNVSTGTTRFSNPGFSAYASMKGAMEILTKYQAKELGFRQIRSNIIAPGAIETNFGGGVVRDNEKLNNIIASNTALGRVGLPDDVGSVVAFLCSDDAKWVNAQRIEVSGGQMI